MTILKVTYGNPVASIKGICEHYQISDRTARTTVLSVLAFAVTFVVAFGSVIFFALPSLPVRLPLMAFA